jgi:hypothetical protein
MRISVGALVVAAALSGALAPVVVSGASARTTTAPPVPLSVQHKMAALCGSRALVPTWVPSVLGGRLIFISWKTMDAPPPNSNDPCGQYRLTFAHGGVVMYWSMYDPADAYDCNTRYGRPDRQRTINGRVVSYVNGNHSDSAYTCVGRKGTRTEYVTGADHEWSPAVSMKIVASAQPAR